MTNVLHIYFRLTDAEKFRVEKKVVLLGLYFQAK